MSRSYKHTPIYKGGWPSPRYAKRLAARKVRHYDGEIPSGAWFKRLYSSWDIYDYVTYCSFRDWNPSIYTLKWIERKLTGLKGEKCERRRAQLIWYEWNRWYRRK